MHAHTHTYTRTHIHTHIHTHTHAHTHAHTHTHTHTHTQAKSTELIKAPEAEERGFENGLKSIDRCRFSGVKWQWAPDRKAKMREGTIIFRLALLRWEL